MVQNIQLDLIKLLKPRSEKVRKADGSFKLSKGRSKVRFPTAEWRVFGELCERKGDAVPGSTAIVASVEGFRCKSLNDVVDG